MPGSRKEVFEGALSLADKRALWRFLKGTSEALQGTGSLQVAPSSLAALFCMCPVLQDSTNRNCPSYLVSAAELPWTRCAA